MTTLKSELGLIVCVMDERMEEKVEDADMDQEGLTNEVYFSEDDTVIKIYPRYPLTSFYATAIDFLAFNFRYLDREERMSNEVEVKDEIKAAGLDTPEIISMSENMIEFERVEGISGYQYLNSCSAAEAYRLGEEVGSFLPRLHSRGVALKDFRVSNMIVGDKVTLIDHEYSGLNANKVLKWFDYFTLLSSVRQTPRYQEFKRGFCQRALIPKSAICLSLISSLAHSVLLERSLSRVKNSFLSVRTDFASRVNNIVRD